MGFRTSTYRRTLMSSRSDTTGAEVHRLDSLRCSASVQTGEDQSTSHCTRQERKVGGDTQTLEKRPAMGSGLVSQPDRRILRRHPLQPMEHQPMKHKPKTILARQLLDDAQMVGDCANEA